MARTIPTIYLNTTEPKPGAWCIHCLLPSAVSFEIWHLKSTGMHRLATIVACYDCGEWERQSG